MPPFGPIKRADLIYYLRKAGFEDPKPGRKHAYMKRGSVKVRIPNPHEGDVSKDLLRRILRDALISREEWEKL
jgi:predicted RNA binding protein YcfA (HicA-like mRNA interferase family)